MTPPDAEPQIVGFARSIAEAGGVHNVTTEQYAVEFLAESERLAGDVWAAIDGVAVIRSDGVKVYLPRTVLTAAETTLREAEKLAERIMDDNDVPEMYGAGQRRAAERILSVLKHARTT